MEDHVSACDGEGRTALWWACHNGHEQAAAVGAATAASASALLGVSVFVFAGTQPGEVDVHTRRTRGDTFAYHELVRTMQAELRGRLPFVPEAALTLRRT